MGRRSTEPASTRGVRARRRLSSGQRAPPLLHLARSVRGMLLSWNPHLRALFILPGGVPASGQQALQDHHLALKRPGVLLTMAATVYRVSTDHSPDEPSCCDVTTQDI
ncbi:hypothetical protein HPB50_019603 [Hyalomma asiaticum]|uniref:Uncharacterized protein n=1 Tax=Hyalomma asiaticum TaxID=266040 RepID=A0ACB7RRY7_HYAAI|nr:hypothetical protein HPB50_019603 [Hyalomma asiaticum]